MLPFTDFASFLSFSSFLILLILVLLLDVRSTTRPVALNDGGLLSEEFEAVPLEADDFLPLGGLLLAFSFDRFSADKGRKAMKGEPVIKLQKTQAKVHLLICPTCKFSRKNNNNHIDNMQVVSKL